MSLTNDEEILNPNIPDLPSKKKIIALCRKKGLKYNNVTYSSNGRNFFIKYNNATMAEARNQLFFYNQIVGRPGITIRIPEIYHAFTLNYRTYIVMEQIDVSGLASDAQRAQAISELIRVEPPPGVVLGPIGGGRVKHTFFKDYESPVEYKSVSSLENHINNILKIRQQSSGKNERVDFKDDKLVCYYSDINKTNFPVDQQGQVWVVDFDQAGVLPVSFMSFALDVKFKDPLPQSTHRLSVPIERTKNLLPMFLASRFLKICVDELGVDTFDPEA